jgi:hypothetical protein
MQYFVIFSRLHFVHHASFVSALELVDKGAVTQMLSPSGRSVYQVKTKIERILIFSFICLFVYLFIY